MQTPTTPRRRSPEASEPDGSPSAIDHMPVGGRRVAERRQGPRSRIGRRRTKGRHTRASRCLRSATRPGRGHWSTTSGRATNVLHNPCQTDRALDVPPIMTEMRVARPRRIVQACRFCKDAIGSCRLFALLPKHGPSASSGRPATIPRVVQGMPRGGDRTASPPEASPCIFSPHRSPRFPTPPRGMRRSKRSTGSRSPSS